MFNKDATRDPQDNTSFKFDRYLLFKDAFVDWHEYDHPQYGKIEIGGFKKNFGRAHPDFYWKVMHIEIWRSPSTTAYHTPKLKVDTIMEKDLGDGLKEVTAVIANKRIMPTHSTRT